VFSDKFYEDYQNLINSNSKQIGWNNVYYWLIEAHTKRLFNNFYYIWLESPHSYTQDINSLGIQFIPHDHASNYLNKIMNDLFNIYTNVNELKNKIKQLEELVQKYKNIKSPINYQTQFNSIQNNTLQQTKNTQLVQNNINNNDYSAYTLIHLKKLCNEKNIKVSGTKKQDYVNALTKQ